MIPDSEYLRYIAESLRTFGERLNVPLPAFPMDATTITFPSGISVAGRVRRTDRPHHLTVAEGDVFSFSGGLAKRGMLASSEDAWGAGMSYHTPVAPVQGPIAMRRGDAYILATPGAPGTLHETVLVECGLYDMPVPPLADYPAVIQGATAADVEQFLNETDFFAETAPGWQGRAGHGNINWTPNDDKGIYGGLIAERTSFGALLLISNLPDEQKLRVQTRLLKMSQDIEQFDLRRYGADGGHGNGRLFPWFIRRLTGGTSVLTASDFSESIQLVAYSGPGALGGYGWRHHESDPVNMASEYVYCCTANRWAGAALALEVLDTNNFGITGYHGLKLAHYTRMYLRWRLSLGPADDFTAMHGRSRELIMANRSILF